MHGALLDLLLRHLEGAYAWSPKEALVGFVKAPKTSFTQRFIKGMLSKAIRPKINTDTQQLRAVKEFSQIL